MNMITLTRDQVDVGKAIEAVRDDLAGGTDVFIGTVRAKTGGREVKALEFEAYEKMAESELEKIMAEASKRWPVLKMAVIHALGRKKTGEVVVVIAVSAAHREASFDACRYLIDELKQKVPIWKKEIFEDGEVWVAAHP